MTLGELFNVVKFKTDQSSVNQVNNTIKTIKSTATKLLGAIGIGFSLTAINGLIEEFQNVNNGIRSSVGELENMNDVQNIILGAANECRSSYAAMAGTVANLVKSSSELFPVEDAVEFSSVITKLLKTAGRNESVVASIMEGFNKSFQKGIVDTETLNKLLEQAPEAANVLANYLGVAKGELMEMATSGTLSVNDLKNAFLESADGINAAFDNVDMTIGDALRNIRNRWGLWLEQTDETLGVTKTISKVMTTAFTGVINILNKARNAVVWLSEKVGGMQNLMKLIAITAGAILVALNFSKIINGLKTVMTFLGGAKLKTLGIIAVIIALALIVDDFINFMKGNNSVIGEMLERAGIDTEAVREKIVNAWEAVKGFLLKAWEKIKGVCSTVFGAIKDFFIEHGDQIREMFSAVWDAIVQIVSTVWNLIKVVAIGIFGALQAFWEKWGDRIKSVFSQMFAFLGRTFDRFIQVVQKVAEFFSAIFSGDIKGALQALLDIVVILLKQIWDAFKTAFLAIWTFIEPIVMAIRDKVIEVWTNIKTAVTTLLTNIKTKIVSIWNSIKSFISNILNNIKTLFKNIWDGIVNAVTTAFEGIKNAVLNGLAFVIAFVTAAFDLITTPFVKIWNFCKETITTVWEGIKTAVSTAINAVKDTVTSIFNTVSTKVSDIWNGIKTFLSNTFNSIKSTASTVWNSIKTTISGIVEGIKTTISNIFNAAKTVVTNIFGGIKDTIKEKIEAARDAVNTAVEKIKGFFNFNLSLPAVATGALETAKTVVSDAVKKVKSFFSFSWSLPSVGSGILETMKSGVDNAIKYIKGLFNFSWSLPNVKLPHFKINGGSWPYGLGGKGTFPSVSISWWKKGGILDGAQIFGMMGGNLLGGGEAGKEAVLPLSELWTQMRSILGETLGTAVSGLRHMAGKSNVSTSTISTVTNSGSYSRSVIQTVEINNEFNGDRAIQQSAAKTMKESARDVTSELARGLAYAR